MYKSKSGVAIRVLMIVLIVAVFGLSAAMFWIVGPKLAAANHIAPSQNGELSPQELFSYASPAVVRVLVRDGNLNVTGLGSGFFISSDGILVTNYHVIKGAQSAEVLRADNSTLIVEAVIAADPNKDLALLKVKGSNLPALSLASHSDPQVGMKVYAIGNPDGLTNTLSEGLVSGLRDGSVDLPAIQTTAPISPGSSGGPLLTTRGQVVGVTTAYLKDTQALNFAVPVHYVKNLVDGLDQVLRRSQSDKSSYWFKVGVLQEGLDNHHLAIEAFEKAVAIQADYADAWLWLGRAHLRLKQNAAAIESFEKAVKSYQWALKSDPHGENSPYEHNNLGDALIELRRYQEAVDVLVEATSFKPDDAFSYCTLGRAYHYLGRQHQGSRRVQELDSARS